MRISRPEKFDARKEYRVGERAIYKGYVIKFVQCSQELKRMGKRCCACVISAEDCPTISLHCDTFSRKDKKNTYWIKQNTHGRD